MSFHIRNGDGSEIKLLDEQRNVSHDDGNDDDREESLASLLGISDHHVIDLETDDDDIDENNEQCETVECIISDEENDNKLADDVVDTNEINIASEGECEEVQASETNSKSDEDETEDFDKLLGSDLQERNVRLKEPVPGTSSAYDAEEDGAGPSDGQPLLPPPERPVTSRSISKPDRQNSTNLRFTDLQKRQQKILLKEVSQKGKICCAIVIVIILVSMSLALLGMAWKLGLGDLYIVGGIFGAGAVLFVIIFIFIRCTAYTQDTYYRSFYRMESPQKIV